MTDRPPILLIGQAPGPDCEPGDAPLRASTTTGRRLVDLIGCTPEWYEARFQRANLLQKFPGKHARDDKRPARLFRVAAQAMWPLLEGRQFVLLGRDVAEAFGVDPARQHFFVRTGHEFATQYAVIPHPSGRCRWYSNEENMKIAKAFWSAVAVVA